MRSIWWSLPGPSSAIERAIHDLQDGRSIVVACPRCCSPKPTEQVIRGWHSDRWRRASQDAFVGHLPAEVIIGRFCPDVPVGQRRDVTALLGSARAGGLYVAVSIDDVNVWHGFRELLIDIERQGKDLDPFQRPTFLVELSGAAVLDPVPTGVTIAWHEWRNVVAPEDMGAYVAVLASGTSYTEHERAVRAAVVRELALSDPGLAEALTLLPLEQLFHPIEPLTDFASDKGWPEGQLDPADPMAWVTGRLSEMNGKARWHSGALAMASHERAIRMRVWRGQLVALFPLIEELRHTAALELANALKPPFVVDGKTVHDIRFLEVGQLWQVANDRRSNPALPRKLREAIGLLRHIRNRLAHLQPVQAAVVQDPAIPWLARRQSHQELAVP